MIKAYSYIRFSSLDQAKGNSLRRQKDAIDAYINKHGLVMADDGEYTDLGKSSFRGDNLNHGLGKFIEKVNSGLIPPGSVLIVESTDRLSRQAPVQAVNLLFEIINKGIKIVTLEGSGIKEYDSNAGIMELFVFIGDAHRAYSESKLKSERISAAWSAKRKYVTTNKITSKGPLWLKMKADKSEFEVIPKRVEIVKQIFKLSGESWGRGRIAKKLNNEKIDSFSGKNNGWHVSSIEKILKSRSVIGYFQPHQLLIDGTGKKIRTPIGEEIPNYYPAIISEQEFNKVRYRDVIQTKSIVGRQGEQLSNLFTGLVYCGFCGKKMTLVSKGVNLKKGGKYLVCSDAARGMGCLYRAWTYPIIEELILAFVRDVDYKKVLNGNNANIEIDELFSKEAEYLSEIEKNKKQLEKFRKLLYDENDISSTINHELIKCETAISNNEAQLQKTRESKKILTIKNSSTEEFVKNLGDVLDEMDSSSPEKKYEIRMRIRQQLTNVIDKIVIYARTNKETKKDVPPKYRGLRIHFTNGGRRLIWVVPKGKKIVTDGKIKYIDSYKKEDFSPTDINEGIIEEWCYERGYVEEWDKEEVPSYE
jgi:DNA invertase Pin-like site-specific DNA recombinase